MKRIWGLIVAASAFSTAVAHADDDAGATLLDGSTTALIMGPTFIPDPSVLPGYIPTIDNLYLQDLGFTGTDPPTSSPLRATSSATIPSQRPNSGYSGSSSMAIIWGSQSPKSKRR
jgi:hypothetical protein